MNGPKVWEENWTADCFDGTKLASRTEGADGDFTQERFAYFEGVNPEARIRLAAQAPAMARLLYRMFRDWSQFCPCCGKGPPEINVPGPDADKWVAKIHAPDCELTLQLKAAGVLP